MSDLFLRHDRVVLNIEPLIGAHTIATRRGGSVAITAGAAAGAIARTSRFAISPNWLIYLPPAPVTIALGDGGLSAALQALAAESRDHAFRPETGSRAYILVCRDAEVARARFAATGSDEIGAAWTSTGRAVCADPILKSDLLLQLRRAAESSGLWTSLATDWLLIEAEVLPWSDEDRSQRLEPLVATDSETRWSCIAARTELAKACARGVHADALLGEIDARATEAHARLSRSRRHFARSATVTPLRILAGEGRIWIDAGDEWQATACAGLQTALDPAEGGSRWSDLGDGHPGDWARIFTLVDDFTDVVIRWRNPGSPDARPILRISKHVPAPACGPDLSAWLNGATNAEAQNALGHEALERFFGRESADSVHQCILGIVALRH